MIRMRNVNKYYGDENSRIYAAHDVSVDIKDKDFIIITGPSGSGKTTLLNLVGGMTRPDSGEILVNNADLGSMNDAELSIYRARTIGFIFQFQSMIPALTVIENILFPSLFHKTETGVEDALALITRLGLSGREKSYARELSTGQQRRVCIARALINKPSLLLCDEPTGDLDEENEKLIMEMIAGANESGATVLMVTHNNGLKSYAGRLFRTDDGRLITKNKRYLLSK